MLSPQVNRVGICGIPPETKTIIYVNYDTNLMHSSILMHTQLIDPELQINIYHIVIEQSLNIMLSERFPRNLTKL